MNIADEFKTNVYYRLMNLKAYIRELDEEVSIRKLSELMDVPIDIIRQDILNMSAVKYDSSIMIQRKKGSFDICELEKEVLEGRCDNDFLEYSESGEYVSDNDKYAVFLTEFERFFLNKVLNRNGNVSFNFRLKKINESYSDRQMKNILTIQKAISQKNYISYIYHNDKKISKYEQCIPLFIVKIVDKELFYLVLRSEGKEFEVRIDKMDQIKSSKAMFDVSDDEIQKVHEKYEYRWEISASEPPFEFSMIVYDEVHLPERLKKQLSNRKYSKWTKMEDGNYLYEDMVSGYDQLKSWVLSLGSSVRVLKPERMVKDIIQSAEQRLLNYKKL